MIDCLKALEILRKVLGKLPLSELWLELMDVEECEVQEDGSCIVAARFYAGDCIKRRLVFRVFEDAVLIKVD